MLAVNFFIIIIQFTVLSSLAEGKMKEEIFMIMSIVILSEIRHFLPDMIKEWKKAPDDKKGKGA